MCGRFALRFNRGNLRRQPSYNLDIDEWEDEDDFVPRYNIAPRSNAPVLRRRDATPSGSGTSNAGASDSASSSSGPSESIADTTSSAPPAPAEPPASRTINPSDDLKLQTMKWGLVPHWSKVEDKTLMTTNARSENLVEGRGMWESIKGKKRCAIPCIGYYEWLTKGKDKIPHLTKRKDGELLFMAGLYDCAIIEGKPLWSFTIVTTEANDNFSWLHERQPVFLTTRDEIDRWLDTSSGVWDADLTRMVRPYAGHVELECYQVPKEVGKVGTESPAFVEPVANRKDGIEAMFSKQKQAQASPTKRARSPATPEPEEGQEAKKARFNLKVEGSPEKKPLLSPAKKSTRAAAGSSSPAKKAGVKSPPPSPAKKTKYKLDPSDAEGSAKITSFFIAKG
ncbi:DUF159 domain-containing protein [Coprinopsis sp. MPI-PUGE-AT-0042]|nr:DUF159 domain-containing protein [Coprinopsis sp. MPI-PUGE-AT-0042]